MKVTASDINTDFCIAEQVRGWGNYRGRVKGTLVKLSKDESKAFFALEDGTTVQRDNSHSWGGESIRSTWAAYQKSLADYQAQTEARRALEAEIQAKFEPYSIGLIEGVRVNLSHTPYDQKTADTAPVSIIMPLNLFCRLAHRLMQE